MADTHTSNSVQASDRLRVRMAVMIGRDNIAYAIVDPLADSDNERLQFTDIPLNTATSDGLPDVAALEEAVYAHPSMLADYGRVDVAVDTRVFLLTPPEMSPTLIDAVAEASLLCDDESIICHTADTIADANVSIRISIDLDAFLRRTFNTPRYHHPIALTARCYSVDTTTPSPVVNLHFADDAGFYVLLRRDGRLLSANRFEAHGATDVLYYTLATLDAAGLTPAEVRIRTSGNPSLRHEVTQLFSSHFDDVAPATLPASLLREGTAVLSLPIEISTLLFT